MLHSKPATISPADTPQVWGIVLLAPYILVFLAFVVYPVGYGSGCAASASYVGSLARPDLRARRRFNTLIFLLIGINIKMMIALFLSGFFRAAPPGSKAVGAVHLPGGPSTSDHSLRALMFKSGMGWVNQLIFKLTGEDAPNWLNDPGGGAFHAIGVHIWKSLRWDADPDDRRLASRTTSMRPPRSTVRAGAEIPLHHLAVDAERSTSPARCSR